MVVQHLAADGCIPRPIEVEGLPAGKMRQVACGGFFTAAVDEDGHVWTWGGEAVGVGFRVHNFFLHSIHHVLHQPVRVALFLDMPNCFSRVSRMCVERE